MRFSILTLFPEYFESPLATSILSRAQKSGLFSVDCTNLRDFGEGRYRAVDDKPYGGGVGMVLMPTVLEAALAKLVGVETALEQLEADVASFRAGPSRPPGGATPHVVYLSPQGRRLDARMARRLASHEHLGLICGHYEGIDERAIETFVHEEISIGDYVLTGGEPAAMVVLDAVARFIPGVVGDMASVASDTFESAAPDMVAGGLKYPMYTRPAVWRGRAVPEVLVSGHHGEIAKWRQSQSASRTAARRPDLLSPSPAPCKKK